MDLNKIDYTDELAQFGTPAGGTFPYLKLMLIDESYHLFEGAIGQDRYQYFIVPKGSPAGVACATFIDKYYIQDHVRHEYYTDGLTLQESCQAHATEALSGRDAYLKYWNIALTGNDKKRLPFYIIPFFDPLAEWFTIQMATNAPDSTSQSKSAATLQANHKKWIKEIHSKVSAFIDTSKITETRPWSGISLEHAKELLHFRDWLHSFLQPSSPPSLSDFIVDFDEEKTFIDTSRTSGTGEIDIFYSVNNRRYPIEIFWIYYKNYHVERALDMLDYCERLTFFKRIVHQLGIQRDKNYEELLTKQQVSASVASSVKAAANQAIENVETRIKDLERYFTEKAEKRDKDEPKPSSRSLQEKIIDAISHAGIIITQTPSLHQNKGEEGIRDAFLFGLYTIGEKSAVASGETFNKEGKTDLCVKSISGITLFVAECKVWKGKNKFHEALYQLIDNYIDWHQERCALLLFVRQADFSNVLKTIRTESQVHPYFIKVVQDHSAQHLSILYRQRDDSDRHILVEIMAFHFFPSKSIARAEAKSKAPDFE